MLLVVSHVWRTEGEQAREEVVGHGGHHDAHDEGHGAQVAQMAATHTAEHLAGHRLWRYRGLLGDLQGLQLVGLVEEVGGHLFGVCTFMVILIEVLQYVYSMYIMYSY